MIGTVSVIYMYYLFSITLIVKLGLIGKLLMQPMIFEMLGVGVGYKKQMGTVHLFEFEVICSICRLWKNLVDGNCRQYSSLLNIFTREWGYKLMRLKASCIPMPCPLSAYLALFPVIMKTVHEFTKLDYFWVTKSSWGVWNGT